MSKIAAPPYYPLNLGSSIVWRVMFELGNLCQGRGSWDLGPHPASDLWAAITCQGARCKPHCSFSDLGKPLPQLEGYQACLLWSHLTLIWEP